MKKIHSRIKRKFKLSTHVGQHHFFHPSKRKRAKTFKTEQSAHNWAKEHGISKEKYSLKRVKKDKKFQIVMKE